MTSIGDFLKEHNLTADVTVLDDDYICKVKEMNGDVFTFSMSNRKLNEHISRFCSPQFVDAIKNNEKIKRTHFLRIAVYWYHIQASGDNLPHEIRIE